MRLTILNQFFYPDHSATSQLMTALAENLVEYGVEVTALAGRGRYNGGGMLPSHEYYKGVLIERAWATSFGKKSTTGRLADYLTFYLGAFWKLLTMPRQDVVMALTTPPLIGLVALIVGRLRKMHFVALMEDVYPDVAIALGALKANSLLTRLLEWLSCRMLRNADRIIVLSDCMLERIVSKVGKDAAERIDVIHNWADGKEIVPLHNGKNGLFKERDWQGLKDKFIVLFSGNLGLVNEFSTVLEAARLLHDRPEIAFVFIGDGARAGEIKCSISCHGLNNIRMLPYQPRELVRKSLGAADVLLVTLADGLAGLSVPSKTYCSLAAGRPILFVGDQRSSVAQLISENSCGEAIASGESERLAAVISEWAANRVKLAGLGSAARSLFEAHFDRRKAVKRYLESLMKCSNPTSQTLDVSFEVRVPVKASKFKKPIF